MCKQHFFGGQIEKMAHPLIISICVDFPGQVQKKKRFTVNFFSVSDRDKRLVGCQIVDNIREPEMGSVPIGDSKKMVTFCKLRENALDQMNHEITKIQNRLQKVDGIDVKSREIEIKESQAEINRTMGEVRKIETKIKKLI